jgi:hypothetical protein
MKMTAEKMPGKKGKRKVRHIRVERAANGYTVAHSLEPQMQRRPGGGLMPMYDEPSPKDAVFSGPKAHKQMIAHVAGLAQQMGDADEGESGAPGGPQPPMPATAA